ncbi:hypothetical protein [Paenibacillus pini]|uniref:Uncharacterized protein n=1 Tax=Paenibacillus pini JCM 16418 TaxID=1236976 RepID=W7YQZ8_9BACL|nr:hypothetical protein [Paenibacillus pini]GAF09853.1 hypothetical protein JCM16418_4011 [Paenibacillus pini JCM 16418]
MNSFFKKLISSISATFLLFSLMGVVAVQAEDSTSQPYSELIMQGHENIYSDSNSERSTNISEPTVTITSEQQARDIYAPPCSASTWRPGAAGYSRSIQQYDSLTNTLQWGFEFTPLGISFFGPVVSVSGSGGSVSNTNLGYYRSLFGGSIYDVHTQASNYLFHGSIKNYNYIGGQAAALNSGDVITIDLNAISALPSKPTGQFSFSCKI